MVKTNGNNIFNNNEAAKKKNERLTIRDRLIAYRNLPKFFMLVWRTNPWLTLASCFLRILQAFLPIATLLVGKVITNQIVDIIRNKNLPREFISLNLWPFSFHLSTLGKFVILEFLLVILIAIFGKLIILVDDLLGQVLTNHTNMSIMAHAATLDLSQFEDSAFYDKLDRARQQSVARTLLLSQLFGQVQDIITIISFLVILIKFNPWLVLMLAVFFLPSIIASSYFNARNYLLVRSQTEGRRQLDYLSLVGSSDATAKEVRLFSLSAFFIKRYRIISVNLYKAKRKLGIKQSFVGIALTIPGAVGFYISFVYIIKLVLAGLLKFGDLTLYLGAIKSLGSITQSSAKRLKDIAQGAYYLQDFFDFFEIKSNISMPAKPRPFPNPIKTGFTFENVGYKYRNSDLWANRNLNFTLSPGEKLALVGENGAGKTTLVKLLSRLYDPTEGRILLDGHDLKEYDLTDIRMHIGIIFQDFIRYQMTASENIAIGNIQQQDNQELIEQSANQSLAHPIIERLPSKYNQMLGHYFVNGYDLSGGEWQKVALARAYMRNSEIIILDEPTAALDARSEYEVFQRFSDITDKKTAILISHRFSTVRMADRIIVLDKGQIIEMGSHEELLEKDGRYAELFQLQALGYK
ncbi:MAG TPA: ABC transporter ATP-binding protein [Mucilaginibacter sp.]|jgi:ATP-binding cassette subfamily B protein